MEEHLLSIDQFNRPVIKNGYEAETIMVYRLFIMSLHTNPITPNMGFFAARYRFRDIQSNISKIEGEFKELCAKYLPTIVINEIQARQEGNRLYIGVSIINKDTEKKYNIIFRVKEEQTKLLIDLIK